MVVFHNPKDALCGRTMRPGLDVGGVLCYLVVCPMREDYASEVGCWWCFVLSMQILPTLDA